MSGPAVRGQADDSPVHVFSTSLDDKRVAGYIYHDALRGCWLWAVDWYVPGPGFGYQPIAKLSCAVIGGYATKAAARQAAVTLGYQLFDGVPPAALGIYDADLQRPRAEG